MSAELPAFLAPPQPVLPSFLAPPPVAPGAAKAATKALLFQQYEMVFYRVLEEVCAGSTVSRALKELPIEIDAGGFMRWLRKDSQRFELYKEAKEVRTEVWTGRMMELAEGTEDNPVELDRAKFAVDTYKWLVSRENKREYGETKTIDVNQNISITAALQEANQRVVNVIDVDDYEVVGESSYLQLSEGDDA